MRFAKTVGAVVFPFVMVAGGCSDGGGDPAKKTEPVPDAAVTVPAPLPARDPITIVVKGNGDVISDDRSVYCGIDAGTCRPPHYGVTLYAAANLPWAFDHWEPSMSHEGSMYLNEWTAATVTAVFLPIPLDGGL